VLGCLIFSALCCRLISPAYPCVMLCCLIFFELCYVTRFGLYNVILLNYLYLMLRCWTFLTACYVSWCSLYYIMLFDFVIKTICCLMLRSLFSLVMLHVFSIYICRWIFCLIFILLRVTCLIASWAYLVYVMLLNVFYIILCYSVLPHDITLDNSLY
jgi:hypothetical protein